MELFVRQVKNQVKYDEFVNLINKQLNLHTLPFFSRKKTLNLYLEAYCEEFLVYRFWLLKEWMQTHERFDKRYVMQLHKLLDILLLEEELTGYELDYIDNYNQIVFSKIRNLKNLIVDFDVFPKENIYFKFDIDVCGQFLSEHEIQTIFEGGEIYITTQRIVLTSSKEYLSLEFEKIVNLHLKPYWFEITMENGMKLMIVSNNVKTFYVALERILSLMKVRI